MIRVSIIRRKSRAKKEKHLNEDFQERTHLYLRYRPHFFNPITLKSVEKESLGLSIWTKPRTLSQREENRMVLERANFIRNKRQNDVMEGEFGFLNRSTRNGDFLDFYRQCCLRKNSKAMAGFKHFQRFIGSKCRFRDVTAYLCDRYKEYLLKDALGPHGKRISANSASGYYASFRSVLKDAYRCNLLNTNINEHLEPIKFRRTLKEYLTMKEVKMLRDTPCEYPVLKDASLFAVLTGLRISDILTLEWEHITRAPDGGPCIIKTIEKSDRMEIVYISDEALSYCGPVGEGLVFSGLTRPMAYAPLKRWAKEAGITKNVTFHTFRRTNATLLVQMGNDIYTVSKMLTHSNVSTTQIYADVVDTKRRAAANSLTLE